MNYFFTSDTHYGHWRICQYCNRPFSSLEEMDRTIIRKFNERVKEDDICFMLGDFCFKRSSEAKESEKNAFEYYRNQLNCKNIIFIKGNHDRNNSTKTIIERLIINYGGYRINLTHNPEHADLNFPINFTGHCHNAWQVKRIYDKNRYNFTDCLNTGVDIWNFYPCNFEELMKRYYQWLKKEK